MTVGDVLRRATDHLARTSETARLDAELLLAHTLGRQRIELYTDFDRPLNEAELDEYRALVARRARHEPVAYILGEWGFRRLTLAVDRRALIPRPETEIVVERALDERASESVLNVGTSISSIPESRHNPRWSASAETTANVGTMRERRLASSKLRGPPGPRRPR